MNSPSSGAIRARRWLLPLEYNLASRQLARLARDIQLGDAFKLRLRELRIADRERLKAFFSRCSPEAIRYRFMSSIKAPSDSLLDYLADADGSNHVALIVTQGQGDDERIAAESRYVIFQRSPLRGRHRVSCVARDPAAWHRDGSDSRVDGDCLQAGCDSFQR